MDASSEAEASHSAASVASGAWVNAQQFGQWVAQKIRADHRQEERCNQPSQENVGLPQGEAAASAELVHCSVECRHFVASNSWPARFAALEGLSSEIKAQHSKVSSATLLRTAARFPCASTYQVAVVVDTSGHQVPFRSVCLRQRLPLGTALQFRHHVPSEAYRPPHDLPCDAV